MKKFGILTLFIAICLSFNSCLLMALLGTSTPFIETNDTLENGVYLEKKGCANTGWYKTLNVDGEVAYRPEGLETEYYENYLTVYPGRKITYTTGRYYYYKQDGIDDAGHDRYVSLNPPTIEGYQEYTGTYKMGKGNTIVFELNGFEDGGPLENGTAWSYEIDGKKFEIGKSAIIDGGLYHGFEYQN